jgi:glycosyltransferase involved in cell wall biosynthesis
MRLLLLNQTFYPDVMATGQHLSEVALALVRQGHDVTVVTSRRAYDEPERLFPRAEKWQGLKILRVSSTGFGKDAKWKRAADFASFLAGCTAQLAMLPRHDVVVALTSPPLVSFLGAWVAKIRGSRFAYWVMDFNPDEAIAAGWLRAASLPARILDSMSKFSLRRAATIIALDRFMKERIVAKGVDPAKIRVIPPWAHDDEVRFDPIGRERFRNANSLADKFVVMYSGNHSPCHPLDTLLKAAHRLHGHVDIVFCFVGGGNQWRKLKELVDKTPSDYPNIRLFPYQPLSTLAASLSAADLHVVVMGDAFLGLVHPCKIYNVLAVGAPVLYIGPEQSHISELLNACFHDSCNSPLPGTPYCGSSRHGDVETVINHILRARERRKQPRTQFPTGLLAPFRKDALLPMLVAELTTTTGFAIA